VTGGTGARLALLAVTAVVALVLAVAVGPVLVAPADTLAVLLGLDPANPDATVLIAALRVPRALTAALAGAALGVAGLQLQTLFRNPLAEPYVLGVSAGASLGVALAVTGTARRARSPPGWAAAGGPPRSRPPRWEPRRCWAWCCCSRGPSGRGWCC
jgi:iron complex transport system permease protein